MVGGFGKEGGDDCGGGLYTGGVNFGGDGCGLTIIGGRYGGLVGGDGGSHVGQAIDRVSKFKRSITKKPH